MAVLKIINNQYSDYNEIEKVINYLFRSNSNGECWGSQYLYCPDIPTITYQLYNMASYYHITGNILHHFVLSFDKYNEDWIYHAPAIACRILDYAFSCMPYAAIWNVHQDTEHLHIHILMSAVNLSTGLKYRNHQTDHAELANAITDGELIERKKMGPLYTKTYGFEGCEPEKCYTSIPMCKICYS